MSQDQDQNDPFAKYVSSPAPAAAPGAAPANSADPFAKYTDGTYVTPPTNSAGKMIRDAALAAVQGTLDMGKDAYGLANIASGGYLDPASRAVTGAVGRGITSVGNALTGQHVEAPTDAESPTIGQGFQQLSQGISGAQSDFHQAAEAQRQEAIKNADGPLAETGAYLGSTLKNPSLLLTDVVGSYPQVLQPAMAARYSVAKFGAGVAERATEAALKSGATKEAAELAGQHAVQSMAENASSLGIGGQVAASNNLDVANGIMTADPKTMEANPTYQALIASGMSDAAARDEMGRRAGLVSAAISGPISLAASKFSGYGKQLGDIVTGQYPGKGLTGVAAAMGHHVAYEYPMQYGEKVSQNTAEQMYGDTNTDLTKGAAGQAASGSLAGAIMGVGEHVAGHVMHAPPTAAGAPAPAVDANGDPIDPNAGGPGTPPLAPALAGGPAIPPAAPPEAPGVGPLTAAAAMVQPKLYPFPDADLAQKQADSFTNMNDGKVQYEVIPHPTVAGRFAAVPVQAKTDTTDGTAANDAGPTTFKAGDPVQVTLNGVDQFKDGTTVKSLSDDGQYAFVDGTDAGIPVSALTKYEPGAADKFNEQAHGAATSTENDLAHPTDAQQQAGNYQKGHADFQGLDVSIENPVGSTRSGTDADGTPWETTMAHHYGYIKGTNGADDEHIDTFIGQNPASDKVFVVDQTDPKTGQFDEHKVMLGFNSLEQAKAAYDANYAPDWKGGENISATTMDNFKQWLKTDTTQPYNPAAFDAQGKVVTPGSAPASDATAPGGPATPPSQPASPPVPALDQAGNATAQTSPTATEGETTDAGMSGGSSSSPGKDIAQDTTPTDNTLQQGKTDLQQSAEQKPTTTGPTTLAETAAAHVKELEDKISAGEPAGGKIPAPGFKRTGIDVDDKARAKVFDDAYREALTTAGWAANTTGKDEIWSKGDQRVLINHPLVGEPGAVIPLMSKKSETTPPAEPTNTSTKPRLAENADDLYKAIKQKTDEGVMVGGKTATPVVRVIGVGDMRVSSQGIDVLSDGGKAVRKATPAEIDDLHSELEGDRAQVLAMSQWGGSGNSASKTLAVLHSPSGNSFKTRAEQPPATGPTTPATTAPAAKATVDYPNRKLGFQKAASNADAAYDDMAWANIAAANMKQGDVFDLGGEKMVVHAVTDKTLQLTNEKGRVITYNPNNVDKWDQFRRDLGGQLAVENLQAKNILKPARPLIDILKRDPAVHVDENGSVYLKDGGIIDVPKGAAYWRDQHIAATTRYNALASLHNKTKDPAERAAIQKRMDEQADKMKAAQKAERSAAFKDRRANVKETPGDYSAARDAQREVREEAGWKLLGQNAKGGDVYSRDNDKMRAWADEGGTVRDTEHERPAQGWGHGQEYDWNGPNHAINYSAQNYLTTAEKAALDKRADQTSADTPFNDPALKDKAVRDKLYQGRLEAGDGFETHEALQAVMRALDGEPMTAREKAFVTAKIATIQGNAKAATGTTTFAANAKSLPYEGPRVGAQHLKEVNELSAAQNARELKIAKSWGYTDETVPVDSYGRVDTTFHDADPAVQYTNNKRGQDALAFKVLVGQAPNGKWAMSTDYSKSNEGGGSYPSLHGKQYDSREAAVAAGVAELKKQFPDEKTQALIDKAAAGELAGLQKMQDAKAEKDAATLPSTAPQRLPLYGINTSSEAERYGLPRDFYAETTYNGHPFFAPADAYRTPEFTQAEAAMYKAHKIGDKDGVKRYQKVMDAEMVKMVAAAQKQAAEPNKQAVEPLALSDNALKRAAEIRAHIDAQLDGDTLLVQQGNMAVNQFKDFKGLYKEAFEKALASLVDRIPTQDFQQFTNRLNLPGYVEKAAQKFIDAHYAAQATADAPPMTRADFVRDLKDYGAIQFGEASYSLHHASHGNSIVVHVTYPNSNKVIGVGAGEAVRSTPPLSRSEAIESAADDAFNWWKNDRQKDAVFQAKREKLVRAGQREIYGVATHLPEVLEAAGKNPSEFADLAEIAINNWVKAQQALAGNDADRKLMLNNMVFQGKTTLPKEFFTSLQKYAQRAARNAEKAAARNPETYKRALLNAATAAGIPADQDQVTLFMAGFDHMLAGKTKSTLPAGEVMAKGYEAAQAWTKTDEGRAYYEGKRFAKLENTGEDLRRWFDKTRASIKDVSADNLTDSYEIIKGQASRVDAFANLAAEDATPGTTRFITDIRDAVIPFQEWLLGDNGALDYLYGHTSRRDADSTKIAAFLDGKAYTNSIVIKEGGVVAYAGEESTPEQRLALIQKEAQRYVDALHQIAGVLQGAKTVVEASEAFTKLMIKDRNGSYWNSSRLTDEGKALQAVFRNGKYNRFEAGTYNVREAIKDEAKPDDPNQSKAPLVTPKLDRVVRENMPDYRKGKDVTPKQFKDKFGLADVGFGEHVATKQDQDHLNYAYDAFMDLSTFLGIPAKGISLGGTLHFTIGALGHGKAAAHFQFAHPHPKGGTVPVINLTNTRGDGTVAHEWFHALDHALNVGYTTIGRGEKTFKTWLQNPAVNKVVKVLSKKYDYAAIQRQAMDFLAGERKMVRSGRSTALYDLKTDAGLIANAESAIDWLSGLSRVTNYKTQADKLGADYWGNPRELLARAAEAYVSDNLTGDNNYLVNPEWVDDGKIAPPKYRGTPYPQGEERKLFGEALGALVKSLRFDDKGTPSVDMDAFAKELPPVEKDYRDALKSLVAELPDLLDKIKNRRRAAELAKENAATEQAVAAAAKAAAEQKAADEARAKEALEQVTPAEPTGPLTDDELNDLFDEVVNEQAEAAQDEPAAKEPGETLAAPAEHWTREDYQFLLDKIDKGDVILLADHAPGLATIHDIPKTRFIGFGTLEAQTPDFDVSFDGGSAMARTPSGQGYTVVHIRRGRDAFLKQIGYDQAKTKLQSKLIVKSGPKAAPTLAVEQEKTATQLAAESAQHFANGLSNLTKGLAEIFGGNKLKSFPAGFDKEAYDKAKPYFVQALADFQSAGKTLKEFFAHLFQLGGPGIKPYAVQFAKDQGLSAQLAPPQSATTKVANWVQAKLAVAEPFTAKSLFEVADDAFKGTQAEGKYSVKDAYDAMEAGVNRYVMERGITPDGSASDAVAKISDLERVLGRLPTQTKRTPEMDEFQQFSTPPTLAFAAAWAANIAPGEVMLEPSAGIGGIAMFGELAGAQVVVNELSSRRAAVLHEVLPTAVMFKENGEQLNNVLPENIKPTVVVMNPPFSSTAGRMPGARDTDNGAQHIEQALKRLENGGRLVAIVGKGMAMDRPAFKTWWDGIKSSYTVRANIGIDGANYAKYGTTFDNQLLVIDKTGPTTQDVLTGNVASVEELPALLEGIRNDRQAPTETDSISESVAAEPGGDGVPAEGLAGDGGTRGPVADAVGAGERGGNDTSGSGPRGQRPALGTTQPDGKLETGPRDGVPAGPGTGPGRLGNTTDGRTGSAANGGGRSGAAAPDAVELNGGNSAVTGKNGVSIEAQETAKNTDALSDAIYENYTPQRLKIAGAKAHPGKLVQSSAMAAVEPPAPTYTPNLPKEVITKGLLSLPQLESVVYAGQAHAQVLPNGERRGFFIGDGTGVGKGREIAGIILDNLRQGKKKAVWISQKQGLMKDAQRDTTGIGGDPAKLFGLGTLKGKKGEGNQAVDRKDGTMFLTYTLLSKEPNKKDGVAKKQMTRMEQVVNWLGKDFDGVIAFDESHNMANAQASKGARGTKPPSKMALAGIALQKALPNARIVYVSATGATEVANLAYATRLGLWGEGTAFPKPNDFISGIEAGGVATMELVSRDMKAEGSYIARSLSYDGVTFERLEHDLTPLQSDIYNELAGSWQIVLQNINEALAETKQDKHGDAKSAVMAQFWGSELRFFNQIITSMQMPSVIANARAQLAAGNAVVMQLVNTNEAEQERQASKIAADDEKTFEDLDFTPRQTLMDYIQTSFPIKQYEQFTDDSGNIRVRPAVDADGKPVINRDMVAKRDALLRTLANIRVPDNPIDMIINAFGAANVAEVTGRSRRFVQERDANGQYKVVEQKRAASAAAADAKSFMDDKKQVMVFSDAGGTGYSFHADLTEANQRKRIHYLVQAGWRADKAVQGFGRTHRTNEASQPHYVLPTTNLKAQKRFISSIARKLDQLGALTKGQRQTGSTGMFSAADNLESQYARDALRAFLTDMYRGANPLNFQDTTNAMGLTNLIDDRTGALNVSKLPSMPQFLNRLLALKTDMQDTVFDQFYQMLEHVISVAKQNGTYDEGVGTVRADGVQKLRDEVVYTDPRTKAETHYIELALQHPTLFNSFDSIRTNYPKGMQSEFVGFFRNEKSGDVFALTKTGTSTDEKGALYTRGRREAPSGFDRYVDNVDQVVAASEGKIGQYKRTIKDQVYSEPDSGDVTEEYEAPNATPGQPPRKMRLTGWQVDPTIRQLGMAETIAQAKAMADSPRKEAMLRLLDKMQPHMKTGDVERRFNAYNKLTPAEAKTAWKAEQAATPKSYTEPLHLITGVLLPIWDRIPGIPHVVRTQTDEGERLLGRTVSNAALKQTLKNLGVGSNIANLPAATVLTRIMGGEKALLANGWEIKKVKVSNDDRLEISGHDLTYNQSARALLTEMGAFTERIQWNDRIFIPTGAKGEEVLARILKSKPLVDLIGKDQAKDDDALLSRNDATGPGMAQGDVQTAVNDVAATWAGAPKVTVVQNVSDLPFKAGTDTRGATYQGRVWLVGANLHSAAEVRFVLGHEAFGHLGLRAIMDESQITQEMNRLRLANPSLAKDAREQVRKYGYDINLATEEALADMAGSGAKINGWQRFANGVQTLLRAVGLDSLADWMESHTAAETMALLRRAREAIEGKRSPRVFGSNAATQFSDAGTGRWYSALSRQVEKMVMKSAPAAQWAATIGGMAKQGVKTDEIESSGVREWLQMQDGKVTKEQVLNYLAENGVQVQDVMKGGSVPAESVPVDERIDALTNELENDGRYKVQFDDEGHFNGIEDIATANTFQPGDSWGDSEAERQLEQLQTAYAEKEGFLILGGGEPEFTTSTTKYDQYTLPGGKNYRELLLTLPEPSTATLDARIRKLSYWPGDPATARNARDQAELDQLNKEWTGMDSTPKYQSPHWDEKNVLAHVRFDDRTDIEGNKVLMIQELQSDWAQQGKKLGFAAKDIEAERDRLHAAGDPAWATVAIKNAGKLPNGPFVGKTDAWVALAVKRMIRYAAENGYDKVAFINGEQSAARYDLSKQVDTIYSGNNRDGTWTLSATKDGATIFTKDDVPTDKLSDFIGKELAQKIIDSGDGTKLSGLDLKVGGAGMRSFYDQIVPNVVNDVLKKLGGGKLGNVAFNDDKSNVDVHVDYNDLIGVWNTYSRKAGGYPVGPDYASEAEAQAAADRLNRENAAKNPPQQQSGFDMTPALRDTAMSGMPLFKQGERSGLLAPNGKPSHLNARLWQQVRTPEFKAWFGDWEKAPAKASRVVDENGEPRVVYHGTNADFTAFDKANIRLSSLGGFWFAERNDYTGNLVGTKQDGFNQMPVFLNIRKPIDGSRFAMARKDTFSNQQVQNRIRDMGGDGVRLDNGRDSVWIATQPNQIKSAIGNNGDFAATNPDIRFSRVHDAVAAFRENMNSAKTLGDLTSSVKAAVGADPEFSHFNAYDKSFSTQYNKALKDKDFRAVFEPVQQLVDDTAHYAIEAERLAPNVLIRLDGFADIANALRQGGKQHSADMAAVAKALFANIEGKEGIKQVPFSPLELQRDFGLTPHQIDLYSQSRLAVDTSIDRLAQSTIMAMGQAAGMDVAHMKDMSLEDTADLVREGVQDELANAQLRAEAEANVKDGEVKEPNDNTMTLHQRIDGIVETANFLKMRAYMPALRFGHYAVTVRDPKAEPGTPPQFFRMYNSQFAANADARKLEGEYPGMTISKSTMNREQYKMFKGVSPETVELFAKFSGMDKEQAYQDYIALARGARSSLLRTLKRQGVAGFSEDVSRVMASFIMSNARQAARNINGQNIATALASPALARKGDVQLEAQELVHYMNNPAEEAQKLRGFMFMYFIGGSVASAVTNLTQLVLQTLPWLTEHVGMQSVPMMLAAGKMAATGNVTDPVLRAGLERANADGFTQPKEIHTLMADATNSTLGNSLRARAMTQAWGAFFAQSESYNRRATFLAAYQAAMTMSKEALAAKGFKDAYDFAVRAIHETQGLYSRANRPNFGRGEAGALLLTFKQFSITYLEMINRMPTQQKLIALSLLTLGAGIQGWPFMENMEDIIDTLGQMMGYNTNIQKTLRKLATGVLGQTFGNLLMHGASRSLGVDMGGRIGLGRMLPGTGMFKLADMEHDTNDVGGPVDSMFTAFHEAFMKAQLGKWGGNAGALAALAPTAVKNALLGVGMATTGQYRDSRERNVMPVNVAQAAAKFFGLQPGAVANESDRVGDIDQDKSMMTVIHASITQRWARAIVDKDGATVQAMVAKWQAWNQNNPGYKIIITPAEIQHEVAQMAISRELRTIKSAPSTMRGEAAADLRSQ